MNLVIDDAVEVKQITKTNDKESRRQLGTRTHPFPFHNFKNPTGGGGAKNTNSPRRANSTEGRQRVADPESIVMERL